jgi:hypothetical protein
VRRAALVALVLASVGFGLCVLGVLPLIVISPRVFDAPDSHASLYPWLIIAGLWSFPLLVGLGLLRAWRAFRGQAYRGALLWLLVPLLGLGLAFAANSLTSRVCPPGELACN